MKRVFNYFLGVIITITLIFTPLANVNAETLCPSSMDPSSVECLDYLRSKLAEVNKKESSLNKNLSNEQYQQLSLQEKISYINGQISSTQTEIESLELEIASKDVEIKLLNKDIQEKEDYLSVLKQEARVLKDTVNKRVTESYKYSFVGPLELFLDSKNIDTILRKTKYLLETREQDKETLERYNAKAVEVESEEKLLGENKASLQAKRNEVEEEKSSLVEQRSSLDSQKAEKARLLAESEKREREMLAQLDANRNLQASLDEAVMAYLAEHGDQMANYGWVSQGNWIGRMGGKANACSTGPHLHFSIDRISTSYWNGYGEIDPWAGYLKKGPDYAWISGTGWKYYYVRSGSMRLPLGGNVVLTQNYHTSVRKAIDMSSLSGYGAPVYAAMAGNLWKGTDRCGDTYAVIENPNTGLRTAYFHLQ